MFRTPVAVFRGEARVFAAGARPYDAGQVERSVSGAFSMPFSEADPGDAFFDGHRVVREEA